MSRARWAAAAGVAVLAGALLLGPAWSTPPSVAVAPGQDVGALAHEHPGAILVLLPGRHHGFTLDDQATVRAVPGAAVHGEIRIRADGSRLEGLVVHGGENGITVNRAHDVILDGVRIERAELHGIELLAASGVIRDCTVRGLTSPYAQGIEIRNAAGSTPSLVAGCHVDGGQEGIVSHVSRLTVRDNLVEGQTLRGIVITEMSEGLAERNVVRDVTGAGLFCGDMSHCEVRENRFLSLQADPSGIRSRSGQAIVAWYYSTIRATANDVTGSVAAVAVDVYHGSVSTDRFPLAVWRHGWRAWLGGVPLTVALLGVLFALRVGAGVVVRRTSRPPGLRRGGAGWRDAVPMVAAAYAIQSFHMVEHVVQVWQTYVVSAEHRSGVLGMRADTEWVHFLYNLGVVVFVWLLWRAVRLGRVPAMPGPGTVATLLATLVLQGYHFVEHAAKLAQHLALGIDPGPGIVGGRLGLVWFHFAINVAVHAGLTVVLWQLWRGGSRARQPGRAPWRPWPAAKRLAPSAVSPD